MQAQNDRKKEMESLKAQGWTYTDIGNKFGISRQRVWGVIGGHYSGSFRRIKEDVCIYPNLRKYMNENKISVRELTRLLYGYWHSDLNERTFSLLRGKDCRKSVIDRVLATTGLTYEEAFARKEDENERKI